MEPKPYIAVQYKEIDEMSEADKLSRLALWYRDQAERAEDPRIWEARLLMAEDLEAQARAAARAMELPPARNARLP